MKQIREMQALHEQKLQQFAKESDVRYRMDLFELDERRSAHIDQLTKTHEEAVEKIQSYFHGVTMNQLALIGTLKEQSEELRQKLDKSEKTAASVSQYNIKFPQLAPISIHTSIAHPRKQAPHTTAASCPSRTRRTDQATGALRPRSCSAATHRAALQVVAQAN